MEEELNDENGRYLTMVYICPWISEPRKLIWEESALPPRGDDVLQITRDERRTIRQLRRLRAAPETKFIDRHSSASQGYCKIKRAFKLHDSVLMVIQSELEQDEGFACFVSARDFRLLRDMYAYGHKEWRIDVKTGSIHQQDIDFDLETVMETRIFTRYSNHFGPRLNDRKTTLPENDNFIVKTFWAIYRGDIDAIKDLIPQSNYKRKVHNMCLMQHAILGKSVNAVACLIETDSSFFLTDDALWYALQNNQLEIARFIYSKIAKRGPFYFNRWFKTAETWLEYACCKLTDSINGNVNFSAEIEATAQIYEREFYCRVVELDSVINLILLGAAAKFQETLNKCHQALTRMLLKSTEHNLHALFLQKVRLAMDLLSGASTDDIHNEDFPPPSPPPSDDED